MENLGFIAGKEVCGGFDIAACEKEMDDDAQSIIIAARYSYIASIVESCAGRSAKCMSTSGRIDRVITRRLLGLTIFSAVMVLVYRAEPTGEKGPSCVHARPAGGVHAHAAHRRQHPSSRDAAHCTGETGKEGRNMATILVLIALVLVLAMIVRSMLRKAKQGGCAGCPGTCPHSCHAATARHEAKDKP